MPASRPLRRLAAPLFLALLAVSCGGGADGGRPIESLELIDFTATGMFRQASAQLQRPYVLELPRVGDPTRHELRMSDTNERKVLEALVELDPALQFSMDGPVWMMWPAGEEGETSPFHRRVKRFQAEGGIYSVLKELCADTLSKETQLIMTLEGQSRPVSIDVKDRRLRDVLAELAAQAHLEFIVEPGYVRVNVAPE